MLFETDVLKKNILKMSKIILINRLYLRFINVE